MEPALDTNIPEQKERLRRLFRVKATETEMMVQRGNRLDLVSMMRSDRNFHPQQIDLTGLRNPTLRPEALLQYRQQTGLFQSRQEFSSVYFSATNPEDRILVLYLGNEPGKQVAKKDFEIVLLFIQTQAFRHIILITETGLNSENNNFVINRTLGYKIEVFLDTQLAFNRTKHALAPISTQHIPARQVPQWARDEQIQAEKLPMILNIDILAKWYGANPYDGFQTEVISATNETGIYYRITRQAPAVRK